MEMTHESYFRISWRCLHKSNRLGGQGGSSPPYSIWLFALQGGYQSAVMTVG